MKWAISDYDGQTRYPVITTGFKVLWFFAGFFFSLIGTLFAWLWYKLRYPVFSRILGKAAMKWTLFGLLAFGFGGGYFILLLVGYLSMTL